MKSISKKIKTIYLLAIMAILSVCMAVFPAFKATKPVKAAETGLSITGAKLEFSKLSNDNKDQAYYAARDFALMFQAEITKDLYDSVAEKNATFGMVIGPEAQLSAITSYDQLVPNTEVDGVVTVGNAQVYTSLVGTGSAEADQLIEFEDGADTYVYSAGTYYNRDELNAAYGKTLTDAQFLQIYAVELTAIPFYIVDGTVNFDASISLTTSAKQEAFDTLIEETALPASQATINEPRIKTITGMTMQRGFGSNEQIYLDMAKAQFFTNFMRGASQTHWKNWSFMRTWFPWAAYQGSGKQIGTDKNIPTYFAGGEYTTAFTSETGKFSASNFTGFSNIANLEAGEKYRLLYIDKNVDANKIIWSEYTPATKVFTAFTNGISTQGQTFLKGYTMKQGGSTSVNSYFAYYLSGSYIHMPYSATSATTKYEVDNWDGHYVLAGDIIIPEDVTQGTAYHYLNTSGQYVTLNVAAAPSTTSAIPRLTIGAMKDVSTYINTFNTALIDNNDAFTGTFDGRGHTIEGSFTRGGIFGIINGGTVKNLNIKANFYTYAISGTTVSYTEDSYKEKAATLAEVIANGALIENVSIELKESAPKTFNKKSQNSSGKDTDVPEMDNVPGIIAAQEIEKSTLRNVVVRCDTLKDAGLSIQNYRAALNVASNCTLDNVFVIGSSYSNMSIKDVVTNDVTEHIMTLSAPEGVEAGTYMYADGVTELDPYFEMAVDMYYFMKKVVLTVDDIKLKLVAEPATKKFSTEEEFQAYITSEEATGAREQLTASGCWSLVGEGDEAQLIWKKQSIAGDTYDATVGTTYAIVAGTKGYAMTDKPVADPDDDVYEWADFAGYSVRVTLASGESLVLPE